MKRCAVLFFALVLCASAHACSCVRMTGSARWASSPLVFVGRVVSTSLVQSTEGGDISGREVVHAAVVPSEVFKGTVGPSHKVIGDAEYLSSMCSMPLLAGKEYLFTLDESRGVSSCNTWFVESPESKELLRTFRRLKALKK